MDSENSKKRTVNIEASDAKYISDIQNIIVLAKSLKAATDTKADAYISFEISEIISALKSVKTQATANIVKITELNKLIDNHQAQLNPCFDLPNELVICAACIDT